MSFVFTNFKRALAEGEIDLVNDDIRAVLVMTDTTFDGAGDEDNDRMDDTTTEDYCDGANHDSTLGHALATQAVNQDDPSNRAEFDAIDLVFTALGVGTRQNQALVIFKWVTVIADSIPIAYIDSGGFNFDGNGGNVTFQWNAQGILQVT